jgi:hypothetical protein
MFWASLAGARADDIGVLERDRDLWEQTANEQEARANRLEQQVGRLQGVLGQWQEEAVRANASAGVALDAFKEVNGESVRDHFGNDETNRRLAEETERSRKHYGLK